VKFYVSALVGIIKVTLRNAQCNNKDISGGYYRAEKNLKTNVNCWCVAKCFQKMAAGVVTVTNFTLVCLC